MSLTPDSFNQRLKKHMEDDLNFEESGRFDDEIDDLDLDG